jgi:uncharacterized RDD family membrane protein YckC
MEHAVVLSSSVRTAYAGFWARVGAQLIDALILSPLILLQVWIKRDDPHLFGWLCLATNVIWVVYSTVLVARFGATPGKLALGLRIRTVELAPIDLRTAALRVVPGWLVWAPRMFAYVYGALSASTIGYSNLSSIEQARAIEAASPSWLGLAEIASSAWVILLVVVMLSNGKRRTVHDFMAGTVVVREPRA